MKIIISLFILLALNQPIKALEKCHQNSDCVLFQLCGEMKAMHKKDITKEMELVEGDIDNENYSYYQYSNPTQRVCMITFIVEPTPLKNPKAVCKKSYCEVEKNKKSYQKSH